jgi:hypothetical protein
VTGNWKMIKTGEQKLKVEEKNNQTSFILKCPGFDFSFCHIQPGDWGKHFIFLNLFDL